MRRAQLPLSLVEVALGAVLILGVALGFALGTPAPDTRTPQLTAYAEDTATVLASESPRHGGTTRLREVVRSESAFERERAALDRRVDRILPENVMYRASRPYRTVGCLNPGGVATGPASVPTGSGGLHNEGSYA